jgi:hypothetical protein
LDSTYPQAATLWGRTTHARYGTNTPSYKDSCHSVAAA